MTRHNFLVVLLFLLTVGCFGQGTEHSPVVDEKYNEFKTDYHNPIAILSTYQYVGNKNMETTGAYRSFYLWKQKSPLKYILIQVLHPKGKQFPEGVTWINRTDAIYSEGNITAYTSLHERPAKVIEELTGKPIPACIIVAQEFYLDKDRKEAIYKLLIVPDDTCLLTYEDTVSELNRVANMQK